MTIDAIAKMLKKASFLAEMAPDPDVEVEPEVEKAVVEAVRDVTVPVVVAIEDAKAIKADEADTSVNPPSVFVSKPTPRAEPVVEVEADEGPPEPMTYRQARMISWLGMIRVEDELRRIHILTKDLDEREAINASWDKATASACIEALTTGNAFKHPEGWTVFLNRGAYRRYQVKQAS